MFIQLMCNDDQSGQVRGLIRLANHVDADDDEWRRWSSLDLCDVQNKNNGNIHRRDWMTDLTRIIES